MNREYPFALKIIGWLWIIGDVQGLVAGCVIVALFPAAKTHLQFHLTILGKSMPAADYMPLLILGLLVPFIAINIVIAVHLLKARVWAYYTTLALLAIGTLEAGADVANDLLHRTLTVDANFIFMLILVWVMLANRKRFLDYAELLKQRSERADLVETAAD